MSSVFDEWKKALEALNNSVEKGIEEVQKCQAQVQGIVPDIIVRNKPGRYIRDDRRIVISAPEIIICFKSVTGRGALCVTYLSVLELIALKVFIALSIASCLYCFSAIKIIRLFLRVYFRIYIITSQGVFLMKNIIAVQECRMQ